MRFIARRGAIAALAVAAFAVPPGAASAEQKIPSPTCGAVQEGVRQNLQLAAKYGAEGDWATADKYIHWANTGSTMPCEWPHDTMMRWFLEW
jgi:hypothetical protein